MDVVDGCAECRRISDAYETATMTWFRQESNLRIAEYGHDENAAARLLADLNETSRRRRDLRSEMERHKTETHSDGRSARTLTSCC